MQNLKFISVDPSGEEQFAVAVPRHGLRAGSARGAGRVGCSHAGAGARAAVEARCGLLVHGARHDDTHDEHASLEWVVLEHAGKQQSSRDVHQQVAA